MTAASGSQQPGLYRAFGLRWQSALPLPELREDGDAGGGPADVTVLLGPAPAPDLPELVPHVRAAPGLFWMEVPGIVRLSVSDGRRIAVEPAPGAGEGDVRAFLLGSAVGALLHQRGILPLHASAVEIGGRAVAFVAPSGGGKSTMAMHLGHLGHRVIADDICAVDVTDGGARLWPGLRNLKLWRQSLAAVGRAPDGFEPVLASIDKYRVPIAALAEDRAFDLAAVVELDWAAEEGAGAPTLEPLPGAAAVGALVAHTFRGQLVGATGQEAAHWRRCLAVFGGMQGRGIQGGGGVYRLTRARALDRLEEASALVVRRFGAAGDVDG